MRILFVLNIVGRPRLRARLIVCVFSLSLGNYAALAKIAKQVFNWGSLRLNISCHMLIVRVASVEAFVQALQIRSRRLILFGTGSFVCAV